MSGDYSQRQVSVWSNNYKAAIPQGEPPSPPMERLMSWLPSNMPHGKQPLSIVHGDFRVDNVVFHPTEVCNHTPYHAHTHSTCPHTLLTPLMPPHAHPHLTLTLTHTPSQLSRPPIPSHTPPHTHTHPHSPE